MADLDPGKRPLSPFMIGPYYRPQMTSISSILTRITGNALIVTFALIVWWLLAAATGTQYFNFVSHVLTSWFGKLVMLLSILGIWYHFLAGLRHLWFDSGRGLEIGTAEKLGWVIIIGSVVLTILTVIFL
jgi:succinate dehydrogenase / fumarate reductase cytochrome b subunit